MNLHRALLLASFLPAALLLATAPLQAQGEMVTDRPDQSESTSIVGRGVFQLETGIGIERDESPGLVTENLEWAGSLLRYGLSDRFELRLAFAGHTDETFELPGAEISHSGFADPELGFKLRLRDGGGRSPAIALLASTTLPIGDAALTSDEYDPTVRVAFDHDLTDSVGLGWNVGYTRSDDEDFGLYSASFGFGITEKWGVFYELFGLVAMSGGADDNHSFDTGITYLVNEDLQLDVAAGVGINGEAPDTFVGLGISWRAR